MAYWHWTLGNTKVQKIISDFGKTPPSLRLVTGSRSATPPPHSAYINSVMMELEGKANRDKAQASVSQPNNEGHV